MTKPSKRQVYSQLYTQVQQRLRQDGVQGSVWNQANRQRRVHRPAVMWPVRDPLLDAGWVQFYELVRT